MKSRTVTPRPPSIDLRSPLAKERDAWLDSEEGLRASNADTLGTSDPDRYLRNRLSSAFAAGAKAQKRITRK